jgi:hypothetical protein
VEAATVTDLRHRRLPRQYGARVVASAAAVVLASGWAARDAAAHPLTTAPPNCASPGGPSALGPSALGHGAAAARYLAIATAGNQRLEIDFDRLAGPDREQLAAARMDLRDAAATEHVFDQCLLAIPFPPQTSPVAKWLFAVNQARARLTLTAAGSTSLPRLAWYQAQLTAANVPVEDAVSTIRLQLGLPPPSSS